MKRSLVTTSFILVFLLIFSNSVFAQDPTPQIFCGSLSSSDCEVLVDSQEMMLGLTSGRSEFGMALSITGDIPDIPADDLSFSLVSSSIFSAGPEATAMMAELQGMTEASDAAAMLAMLSDIYGGVESTADLTVTLSEDVIALIAAGNEMDIPETFTIHISLVGGIIYVNLSELATVTPEAAGLDAWYGFNLIEILDIIAQQVELQGVESMDPSGLNTMSAGAFLGLGPNEALLEFAAVERLADGDVDGQGAAVFLSTFDFLGFLGSPTFREIALMQMEQAGNIEGPGSASRQEMEDTLTLMGTMAPLFLDEPDAGNTQTIGLDDLYLHQSETHFLWDLGTLIALAEMAETGAAFPDLSKSVIIDFAASSSNSDFDAAVEITAPEEAILIPTESIFLPPPSN